MWAWRRMTPVLLTSDDIIMPDPLARLAAALGDRYRIDGELGALGCVLFEMLAGEPPYTGPTAQAILAKRRSQPVPPLGTFRESVPAAIDHAVRRALARVPADRFADATQLRAAVAGSSRTASDP